MPPVQAFEPGNPVETISALTKAVKAVTYNLKQVRDSTRDLDTHLVLSTIHGALSSVRRAMIEAQAEIARDADTVGQVMLLFSMPVKTPEALSSGAATFLSQAADFYAFFGSWFAGINASDIYAYTMVGEGDLAYPRPVQRSELSETVVAPLRSSPQLNALIEAFEAVGG